MALKFYDRVRVTVANAPGTGVVALSSPITAFQSFASAGAANGDTFPYLIVDGSSWEFGIGTYNSTGPTISRTTMTQSSTGSAISFTSSAVVTCTLRGEDVKPTLASLNDVTISSLTTSQVLTWNGTAWVNAAPSGGGSSTLASDTDVSLSSPSSGQVLTYNGTAWVNAAPSGGGSSPFYELGPFVPPQASWFTAHNQSGTTSTLTDVSNRGLSLQISNNGDVFMSKTAPSGTTWAFTARLLLSPLTNTYPGGGIIISDGTKYIQWGVTGTGNSVLRITADTFNSVGSYNGNLFYETLENATNWFRIRSDATNWYFGMSTDGIAWVEKAYGHTWLSGNPTLIGFGGSSSASGGQFNNSNCGFLCTYWDDPTNPSGY